MSPYDIYILFQQKVNKNSTNTNISVPLGVFVSLWNEQKRIWLNSKTKQKESTNYIEDLQELLIIDMELEQDKKYKDKVSFKLPTDYFRRVISHVIAEKDYCKGKRLTNHIVKPKDVNILLQNADYSPSFEWEETISVVTDNTLTVYKDNFTIKKTFLTYYKEPEDLDIKGYTKLDGTPSEDRMVSLSKKNIEEITNRTVAEAFANYEHYQQTTVASQRVQKNELDF